MIVYRELSSLSADLGISPRSLYSVSYRRNEHYHRVCIPKANGEERELFVPDEQLKHIQRMIATKLLAFEAVSPFAMAYRRGGSTKKNAFPHVGKRVILKLDIRHFFDNIIYPMVKETVFPAQRYSEANRILLTMLCMHRDALPQGAPTSPIISNIVMRAFDDRVGRWCAERRIVYTRYCDDMTFSGDFDPGPVIQMVRQELRKLGLFLNDRKTTVVHDGQRKTVTGIVVNDRPTVPKPYRRQLRQELYYAQKFGLQSQILRRQLSCSEEQYLQKLLGRVNYVLQILPDDEQMQRDKQWLLVQRRKLSSTQAADG